MSADDDNLPKKPPHGRVPRLKDVAPGIVRPPLLDDEDEEDVSDEATWAAGGSPYLARDNTAEVTFFDEDRDATTGIDWNTPSSPMGSGTDGGEDTLNFDVRPSNAPFTDAGQATDYPTEPGFGGNDGSLSALRDAMRAGHVGFGRRSRRRAEGSQGAGHTAPSLPQPHGGTLPLPPPRARTDAGGGMPPPPPRPPVPRALQAPRSIRPPQAPVIPPAPRRRRRQTNVFGVAGPLAVGGILLFLLAVLVIRTVSPTEELPRHAPMLPVVGGPPPKAMPAPPFDVDTPSPFRPGLANDESTTVDDMRVKVMRARASDDVALAAAWSDKLVRTQDRPALFFRHAELLADAGDVNGALYWLVRSVQEHGVPPSWLVERRTFARLWIDDRWNDLIRWVVKANRYHAARGPIPATIVLPADLEAAVAADAKRTGTKLRRRAKPADHGLPVVLWLADVAGNGSDVLPWAQALADDLAVVVVGIGGPERIGPAGSEWTSDPERDRAHVDNALAAMPTDVSLDDERRYLVGAGQGAQYAVELVLRDKDVARGVYALSPTQEWNGPRDKAGEGKRDRDQFALLSAGAFDPESATVVRLDRGRLMRAGIDVTMAIDEEPWPDGTPLDIDVRLRRWLLPTIDPDAEITPDGEIATKSDDE